MAQNRQHKGQVCVLDIGSSTTVCIIGQNNPALGLEIQGVGTAYSSGIRSGAIVDLDKAERGIRLAVDRAETQANCEVRAVIVNLGLKSLQSHTLTISNTIPTGTITDRNLKNLLDEALATRANPEEVILHAIPLSWRVDDADGIEDPRGMCGETLTVTIHFISAKIGALRNLSHTLERCHLKIKRVVATPYAASRSVLTDDERDLGVTVIDIGCGLTSAAVYQSNQLLHCSAISLAGAKVTSDIKQGLGTPHEAANRIKHIQGSALGGRGDEAVPVPCPPAGALDELTYRSEEFLTTIIRARIEEIFETINAKLIAADMTFRSGSKIVLTGGTANLPGIAELAELVFSKRVRVASPHIIFNLDERLRRPDYAVAFGLLHYAFNAPHDLIDGPPDISGRQFQTIRYQGGIFHKIFRWLRDNF